MKINSILTMECQVQGTTIRKTYNLFQVLESCRTKREIKTIEMTKILSQLDLRNMTPIFLLTLPQASNLALAQEMT